MPVIKIILGIVLFLSLLTLLRVGVCVRYKSTLTVELRIGPVKRTLYPAPKKKPAEQATAPQAAEDGTAAKKKRFSLPKLTREEWREGLDTALLALKRTARKACRRLRIDPLEVSVIFGGKDPADTAIHYGRANAVLWNLMPRLEEIFKIPDPAIHLGMDYASGKSVSAEGEVGVQLRICDLIVIVLTLAVPLLKWYRRVKKAHRNDPAPVISAESGRTTNTTNDDTLCA